MKIALVLLVALAGLALAAEKEFVVIDSTTDDNGYLDDARENPDFNPHFDVDSLQDMVDDLCGAMEEGDCIKKLTIVGHGAPGVIGAGDGEGDEFDDGKFINGDSTWHDTLAPLKDKMCEGAEIILWGCKVARNQDGREKLQELADYFNATVQGQTGNVYGDGTAEEGSTTVTATPTDPAAATEGPTTGTGGEEPRGPDSCTPSQKLREWKRKQRKSTPRKKIRAHKSIRSNVFLPGACDKLPEQVADVQFASWYRGRPQPVRATRNLLATMISNGFAWELVEALDLGARPLGTANFVFGDGSVHQVLTYEDGLVLDPATRQAARLTCLGQALLRALTMELFPADLAMAQGALDKLAEIDPDTAAHLHELFGLAELSLADAVEQAEREVPTKANRKLNNALGNISGMMRLLEEIKTEPTVQAYYDEVHNHLNRLLNSVAEYKSRVNDPNVDVLSRPRLLA